MASGWDPQQYLRFKDERARPFDDLLARIPAVDPRAIVDLGCGPGNTTAQLVERWPHAIVCGIDSSPAMIGQAQAREVPGRLFFQEGDLRDWEPDEPLDVLLTCATLQWVPDHIGLFERFVRALAAGGVFAFQVPGNFFLPSKVLLHELSTSPRWRDLLGGEAASGPRSEEPDVYLTALLKAGASADVWETTYFHLLEGPDAVLEWIRGTGLRPTLARLEADGADGDLDEFLLSYSAALRAAYPSDRAGRTVFPFRRIFGVATRA